jgi:hypothetical protein
MTENYELFDRSSDTDSHFLFSYKKTKENMVSYSNIMEGISKDKEPFMISSDVAREINDNSDLITDSFYNSIKHMSDKWYERKYNMKIKDLHYASKQNILNYYYHRHFNNYQGWSIAPYDPNELLNAYPCLRVKHAYKLAAYQFQFASDSGYARIFVIPIDTFLPLHPPVFDLLDVICLASLRIAFEREFNESNTYREKFKKLQERINLRCLKMKRGLLKYFNPAYRPLPSWAQENIMDYIEGDQSVHSYFQFSLFSREIYQIGRFGHMPSSGPRLLVLSWDDLPDESTMFFDRPSDFRPVVWNSNGSTNVSYYGSNRIQGDIYLVNDEYPAGLQSIKSNEIVIGHTGEILDI